MQALRAASLPLAALVTFKHSPYIYKTTIHVYHGGWHQYQPGSINANSCECLTGTNHLEIMPTREHSGSIGQSPYHGHSASSWPGGPDFALRPHERPKRTSCLWRWRSWKRRKMTATPVDIPRLWHGNSYAKHAVCPLQEKQETTWCHIRTYHNYILVIAKTPKLARSRTGQWSPNCYCPFCKFLICCSTISQLEQSLYDLQALRSRLTGVR